MAEYDYETQFQEELAKVTSNSLKHKLVAIKNLVTKRLDVEKEFKRKHYELEAKYENLYKPFYQKRADIVTGNATVNIDEIKDQLTKVGITDINAASGEKGVPDFWLKCLKNSSQFGAMINKNDEKVLKDLKDINIQPLDNGSFVLNFEFNPNSYFDHTTISRTFTLDAVKQTISKIESTKIDWKSDDVNPTVEKKKKTVKNKKTGTTKPVVKIENVESFFNFFKNYDVEKIGQKKSRRKRR